MLVLTWGHCTSFDSNLFPPWEHFFAMSRRTHTLETLTESSFYKKFVELRRSVTRDTRLFSSSSSEEITIDENTCEVRIDFGQSAINFLVCTMRRFKGTFTFKIKLVFHVNLSWVLASLAFNKNQIGCHFCALKIACRKVWKWKHKKKAFDRQSKFFINLELVVRNWDRDKRVFKIGHVGHWCDMFSLPHLPKLQMKVRCHWAYLCKSNSAMEVLSVLFSLFFQITIFVCSDLFRWNHSWLLKHLQMVAVPTILMSIFSYAHHSYIDSVGLTPVYWKIFLPQQ